MNEAEGSSDSSEDASQPLPPAERLLCPSCEEEVDIPPESVGRLVRCPYCNTDFFASQEHSRLLVVDDTVSGPDEVDRDAAFDKLRIENFTALRMGAIRARSWWTIAQWLAIFVVLDMVGKTIIEVSALHRFAMIPVLRVLASVAASLFARHAHRRAADFKREIDRSALSEPTVPPDFSTLSDGSDRWKNLEEVR